MSVDGRWRRLKTADLDAVVAIAASAFPEHYEDPAHFAERLELSPSWCYGLETETGALEGYLIAYPWPLGSIPPLNAPLGRLPDEAGALFLHDLALKPTATGGGQARVIVDRLAEEARLAGLTDITLVAVNDTASFWRHQGFADMREDLALRTKLETYGADALYMRRRLGDHIHDQGG